MSLYRRAFISLVILGCFLWGSVLTLRALHHQHPIWKFNEKTLLVIQLNVGQGDALLIISPDRKVTLIDVGPVFGSFLRTWDAGKNVVIPTLRGLGLTRVDQIILTHHDMDHMGGILSVLKHLNIGQVFDNGRGQLSHSYQEFKEILSDRGLPLKTLKEGDDISLGEGTLAEVLSPQAGGGLDGNNTSLVLRVTYGHFKMIVTGDIENLAEENLCAHYGLELKCDFLKVPHHGSKTSSSFSFLRLAQPRVAGISVGKHNSYGHPSPIILNRYARLVGRRVCRTDWDGGLLLVSNGTECFLVTEHGKSETVNL